LYAKLKGFANELGFPSFVSPLAFTPVSSPINFLFGAHNHIAKKLQEILTMKDKKKRPAMRINSALQKLTWPIDLYLSLFIFSENI